MIKLLNILKEAKIVPASVIPSVLPKQDAKLINDYVIGDDMFQGGDLDINEPIYSRVELSDYPEEYWDDGDSNTIRYKALKNLLIKYPIKRIFVTDEISFLDVFEKAPYAPKDSFKAVIILNPKKQSIEIGIPFIDEESRYLVGWFNSYGKYYPDTKSFNEDGSIKNNG